jgi:hypothetical protein
MGANMCRNVILGLVVLVATAFSAPASAQVMDPIGALTGRWQIVDSESGDIIQSCEDPQVFAPSKDTRFVNLEPSSADEVVRYMVIQSQPGRALMFIEGESRLTDSGDPVLWWAMFVSADAFRWRRYDWLATEATLAEWRRCPG